MPSASQLFRSITAARRSRVDDAAIQAAEAELGVSLPTTYTSLLRDQNGGYLRLNGIWSKDRPSPHHTDRRIYELDMIAGIGTTESYLDLRELAEAAHKVWSVPTALIPIAGDGHWWLCMDYRECGPDGSPCITHFEPAESVEDDPVAFCVADSFDALISGLFFDSPEDLIAVDRAVCDRQRVYEVLSSLGATPWKEHRHQWWWSSYRYTGNLDDHHRCFIAVFPNGTDESPSCPHAAGSSLLLHVAVDNEDRPACLGQLLAALAPTARLVHQPADRPHLDLQPNSNSTVD